MITIFDEIEKPLEQEAHRLRITPEMAAIESLCMRFIPISPEVETAPRETLLESLREFVGVVDGTAEPLSEECGKHF